MRKGGERMWKIAIDLGSSTTKISRADASGGVQLDEPSCVAVDAQGEVKAVGKEAKNLIGKTAEYTKIIYPIYEGEIVDVRLATEMLGVFFERIGIKKSSLRKVQAVFSVPCGVGRETRAGYTALAEECGIRKAFLVEQPYLSAVSASAVLSQSDPVFCMDIGGGVTNVAVVSADGIIAGLSMNIGGMNIDYEIQRKVERACGLQIGAPTAERLKKEVGSLLPTARGTMVAEGRAVQTSRPAAVSVQASDITDCIRGYIDKILQYTGEVLRRLPAEVAATVNRNGVYLSGGLMRLSGLPQYIAGKLEMRYHLHENPQYATIEGAGAVASNKELFHAFAKDSD